MILICMFLALVAFFYFQQVRSNRNLDRFRNSREKYEELLRLLREKEEKDRNEDNEIKY